MRRIPNKTTRRCAQVALPGIALVAVLVFVGVVLRWPTTMVVLVSVVGAGLTAYVIAAARVEFDPTRRWLQYGRAATTIALTACSAVGAVTTYHQWVRVPQQHASDTREVAAEASTVANLLTTITDSDRTKYLQQLRPHVTDDVLQALNGDVVGLLPSAPFTQEGVVQSVAVEIVNDGAATAIAVVRPRPTPTPPTKGVDPDPNTVILFLLLARYQDRWVVANLAPLGVRSGYPG